MFAALIRFSTSSGYWLNVILLLISRFTVFIAGLGDNFEFDLRRIVALSSLSQLTRDCKYSLELLMMSGVQLETC